MLHLNNVLVYLKKIYYLMLTFRTEKDLKRLEKYRIRLKELRETLETGK